MPGISNEIQKKLKLKNCICLDILAGCSGFINAFDIAKLYIESGRVKKALVIGVDKLSKYTDKEDADSLLTILLVQFLWDNLTNRQNSIMLSTNMLMEL